MTRDLPVLSQPQIKEIPGHVGYAATGDGRILSRWKLAGRHGYVLTKTFQRILRSHPARDGRLVLKLPAHTTMLRVHRLVLLAFKGPCPAGLEGCHNNGRFEDNRICNLRWDTHASNCEDRTEHGQWMPAKGERNGFAKFTETDILTIRSRRQNGETLAAIAGDYKANPSTIGYIVRGNTWKHVL